MAGTRHARILQAVRHLAGVPNEDAIHGISPEEDAEVDYHKYIGVDAMMLSLVLIFLVVSAHLAEKYKLPASTAAILIGAAIGGIIRATRAHESDLMASSSFIVFDEELFLYILLPPIIFEAGFTLSKRHFFGNLGTILLFAVVGTLASTFVIGQTLVAVGSTGTFRSSSGRADALDFSTPLDAYLFGALISATDPVATLSIMGAVNADPVVYTLVFGESVLNDAVAIVLVNILESMGEAGFQDPSAFGIGVVSFFTIALGSLGVGVGVSALSALLLKRVDLSHHPSLELALMLLFGYCAYATAEAVSCSGILGIFTAGVLMGTYHVHSISQTARETVGVTLKAFAHLSETAVFAYMGVDLFALSGAGLDAFFKAHHWSNASEAAGEAGGDGESSSSSSFHADGDGNADGDDNPQVLGFIVFALAIVLLARVIVVLPLCVVANTFRGQSRQLTSRVMAMLVFAGLRGAIAFALAHNIESQHGKTIAAATTTVVLFTTFVLGGLTRRVLRCLRMEAEVAESGNASMLEDDQLASDTVGGDSSVAASRRNSRSGGAGAAALPTGEGNGGNGGQSARFMSTWSRFDANYLQPAFGGPGPRHRRMQTLPVARVPTFEDDAPPAAADAGGVELREGGGDSSSNDADATPSRA